MSEPEFSMRDQPIVRVFGSALLRVAPDTASIVIAVSRAAPTPEVAFAEARQGAQAVNAYLLKSRQKDFGSSRVTLSQEWDYLKGERRFIGYTAKISFNVIVRELERLDDLLTGLISIGANELTSVTYQTTRLKALRADARRRAVAAARDKAELYCQAAGVSVGRVITLEDENPESLSGRHEGHTYREPAPADDSGSEGAIDPASITIAAAVNVTYRIE